MIITCQHISSLIFGIGTCSFVCSLLVHIEIWRTIRPSKQIRSLAIIFVFCPLLVFVALFVISNAFHPTGSWFVRDPFNITYVYIWHLALSATYIMSYPASQAECPSLAILLAVKNNMPVGLSIQEIKDIFPPDSLIKDRYNDLHAEHFIKQSSEGHVATSKGRFLRAIFINYRRVLGLPRGEG